MTVSQLDLFHDTVTDARKSIVTLPLASLHISPLNPRATRPTEHITTLAERMQRNGFEITRALWARKNNDGYEVFAGGTRFEAARQAGLESVPVVLHEGYSDEQIVRLADEDNENDEYHRTVPIVDTWLSYKALADAGWTQQRIAAAKGVKQSQVSERLAWAELPSSLLDFIKINPISDSHMREITKLSKFDNLGRWLSFSDAALEVCNNVFKRSTVVTSRQFSEEVTRYNTLLSLADSFYQQLESPWQELFLDTLTKRNARIRPEVQSAYNEVQRQQLADAKRKQDELAQQQSAAEAERLRLEREREKAQRLESLLVNVVHSNARQAVNDAPDGIALVLTDPPYGMDYQSNRRVVSAKAAKIEGDSTQEGALTLLVDVMTILYSKMRDNSMALVWCSWREEPLFRDVLERVGFVIKGSLIWNKPNHGTGDLEGGFAPKHERIIHAVKGNPKLNKRIDDVLDGREFLPAEHPTRKPVDLLRQLIAATTNEGDIVVDPFVGIGSTVAAAYTTHRRFWACELDVTYHQQTADLVYGYVQQEGN